MHFLKTLSVLWQPFRFYGWFLFLIWVLSLLHICNTSVICLVIVKLSKWKSSPCRWSWRKTSLILGWGYHQHHIFWFYWHPVLLHYAWLLVYIWFLRQRWWLIWGFACTCWYWTVNFKYSSYLLFERFEMLLSSPISRIIHILLLLRSICSSGWENMPIYIYFFITHCLYVFLLIAVLLTYSNILLKMFLYLIIVITLTKDSIILTTSKQNWITKTSSSINLLFMINALSSQSIIISSENVWGSKAFISDSTIVTIFPGYCRIIINSLVSLIYKIVLHSLLWLKCIHYHILFRNLMGLHFLIRWAKLIWMDSFMSSVYILLRK